MRRAVAPSLIVAFALFLGLAHAAPATKKPNVKLPSKSIGAPNAGLLENGVHLDEKPYLHYVGEYGGDAYYGVRELVEVVDRAAREVRRRYPDAILGVGQLSRKGGGEIDRHHSHESGRDVDLAFYLVDSFGRSVHRGRYYAVGADGIASDPKLRFDDGRNFALLASLLGDGRARVTHVFVANHLRTRLLAYAARVGASPLIRQRMAEVLMQPRRALPHDDHFHVRISCPPGSKGQCIEQPLLAKKPALAHPAGMAVAKTKAPKAPTKKLVRARATLKKTPPISATTATPITAAPAAATAPPMVMTKSVEPIESLPPATDMAMTDPQ
jgi:penicillin-insensitive murein DD-endopeptidase